jgi:hypothetical protein
VRDKFGGIPTIEQLKQSWDEQEAKIRLVFGEPQSEPEPQKTISLIVKKSPPGGLKFF